MKTTLHVQRLLLGAGLLFSGVCLSQPTLTGANTNPVIGEVLGGVTTAYFNPGSAGANQTWNFASLTSTGTSSVTVVSVGSTAHGSSFPNATFALAPSASSTSYYAASSSSFQYYGDYNGSTLQAYSNPEDLLRYPFTYGNSYSDPYTCNYMSSAPEYRKGTVTVTADGYGTLILPNGTFSNVLRVHMVESQVDSANLTGFVSLGTYRRSEYAWYLPGNAWMIASCDSITINSVINGTVGTPTYVTTGGYTSVIHAGIEEMDNLLQSLHVYPNPSHGVVTLQFDLNKTSKYEVNLFNYSGQKVGETIQEEGMEGSNLKEINTAGLAKGIYFVQVTDEHSNVFSRKIVVE